METRNSNKTDEREMLRKYRVAIVYYIASFIHISFRFVDGVGEINEMFFIS